MRVFHDIAKFPPIDFLRMVRQPTVNNVHNARRCCRWHSWQFCDISALTYQLALVVAAGLAVPSWWHARLTWHASHLTFYYHWAKIIVIGITWIHPHTKYLIYFLLHAWEEPLTAFNIAWDVINSRTCLFWTVRLGNLRGIGTPHIFNIPPK